MAEPTVEIPARLALLASKHLHHLAVCLEPKYRDAVRQISEALTDAVAGQCDQSEIDMALVAAKLEEHSV